MDLAWESFRKDPSLAMKTKRFRKSYIKSIRKELFFLPESPIFVSAQTGYDEAFLNIARDLNARMDKSISTSTLNKLIGEMWEHRLPASGVRDSKSSMQYSRDATFSD